MTAFQTLLQVHNLPLTPRKFDTLQSNGGLTILNCLLVPLTMDCFNPAQDLAPCIFSSITG